MLRNVILGKAEGGEDLTHKYFHEPFQSHKHNGLINGIEIIFLIKLIHRTPPAKKSSVELN